MLDQLIQHDKELFLFLNHLGSSTWDGFWLFVTNKFSSIPLYAVLLFVSYRQLGLKKTAYLIVFMVLSVVAADQLANFFKYGVQRPRPCYDPEISGAVRLVRDWCGGKYGYFSSHASNSFAVAVFFMNVLNKKKIWAPILLLWAVMVAYSRIYVGVHFPLDVLTGTLVGILLGWLFYRLYGLWIKRFEIL